jgi:hypothetical protein
MHPHIDVPPPEGQVIHPEANEFRNPQAPGDGQMTKGAIPGAGPGSGIGSIQQSLLFHGRKEMNDPAISSHFGTCQHTADLIQRGGEPIFHETHERLDGRQAEVTGPRTVGALGLEMVQEAHHQWGIEMLELEIRRRDSEPYAGEPEKKLEGVCVGITSVLACAAFQGKPFTEKGCDMGRDGIHGSLPSSLARQASEIPAIRWGVAWMYQYVFASFE